MLGWPAVMHLWLVGLQPRDGGQVRREGRCWHPVLGLGLCLLSPRGWVSLLSLNVSVSGWEL